MSSSPNAKCYQCVAFDAVDTLIHAVPTVSEAYHLIGSRYGCQFSQEEIRSRFSRLFSNRQLELQTDEESELAFWREIVDGVIGTVNSPEDCFQELYAHFAKPSSWSVDPSASTTIQTLRQRGITVAVASNFDHRLHGVLNEHAAFRHISLRVISAEIGWRKPSGEFYNSLIEHAGCPADRILMIGDDLQNDVLAAQRAGLAALHYVPKNGNTSTLIKIQSLTEVLEHCVPLNNAAIENVASHHD